MKEPRLNQSLAQPNQVIYRPKYRQRVVNPGYELEKTSANKGVDASGLFKPLEALEAWVKSEAEQGSGEAEVRWHPEKSVLKVFLDNPPDMEWQGLVYEVSKAWEAALAGRIRFMLTPRKEEADIVVAWSEDPVFGREYEVGHCDREIQTPCWIRRARVTLVIEPEIERHLNPQQIKLCRIAALLHEMGHALGLEHSRNEKDVMHHQGWKNARLTENDIKRLETLYTKPIPTLFII